jgi:hypothetical protein
MNAFKAALVCALLQGAIVLGIYSCATPPTPVPTPTPDAAVVDAPVSQIFAGITVDCDDADLDDQPVFDVLKCASAIIDACMVDLVQSRTIADIVCTARDLSQSLHIAAKIDVDAGTAAAQALFLDDWLTRHGILIRSE